MIFDGVAPWLSLGRTDRTPHRSSDGIRDLAAYERTPNAVVATEEDQRRYGFGPERQFEALLAFLDGEPAGFALFHPRFSTGSADPGCILRIFLSAKRRVERGSAGG
jgi:hypothetical protein